MTLIFSLGQRKRKQREILKSHSQMQVTTACTLQPLPCYISQINVCRPDSERTTSQISRFENWALRQYAQGSPQQDLLISFIHFNIARSLVRNTQILEINSQEMDDNAISRFCALGPKTVDNEKALSLPLSLQPTNLQKATPHHPWLDIIPVAKMRDNIISAGDSFDDRLLCRALRGLQNEQHGNTGVVVWSESWDPTGWELTESFSRDWDWTIAHCWSLFESTNYWRSLRGERPLFCTRTGSILDYGVSS